MSTHTINLRDLVLLIADPSSYLSTIVHRMLRGFGANKIMECRTSIELLQTLTDQKIDVLLCDANLPPLGGLTVTQMIRRKVDNENRTIPILLMSSDTRETAVKQARDAGANMVIAKPISPASLYDRLAWVALTPRQFVDAPTYFGPDRRFKIEGYPEWRRASQGRQRPRCGGRIRPRARSGRHRQLVQRRPNGERLMPDDNSNNNNTSNDNSSSNSNSGNNGSSSTDANVRVFDVETTFQKYARRPGGVPRDRAIKYADEPGRRAQARVRRLARQGAAGAGRSGPQGARGR